MLPHLTRLICPLAVALAGLGLAACAATPPPIQTPPFSSSTVPATGTLPPASLTPGPGASATPLPSASGPAQPTAEIELAIPGGPYAGSYRAVALDGCTSDAAQNRFDVAYSDDAAADGFVALELTVRDAALAEQDETDDFGLTISVGGPAGATYTIDPPAGQGDGTVLLEVTPIGATVDLTADADDGTEIELSIICGAL